MNLNNLDFNLLKVLDALIAEGSVTKAGERLGRSQPAISNALGRLRTLLGDELFIRGPHGFVLTPRAEALRQPLSEALELLETCVLEDVPFDPAKATGVVRLSMPDRLNLAFLPTLVALLNAEAPKLSLQVVTADRGVALELLEDHRIDLALGWLDEQRPGIGSEFLLNEPLCFVCRQDHPLIGAGADAGIDALLSYPHLVVSATGTRTAIFDDMLKRYGLQRECKMAVSNFTAVPLLLERSDMVSVFTRSASDVFETSFNLAKRPVPLEIGEISTSMIWHIRNERDKRHQWLRRQIRELCQTL